MPATFPALSKENGNAMGMPDVCKTPSPGGPVPIPYPNFGMIMQATKVGKKVKIRGKPPVVEQSEIPQSTGNEAGTAGGVVSETNRDKVIFPKGSSKVKVGGKGICGFPCLTKHNGASANMPAGMTIAPSQPKVFVST